MTAIPQQPCVLENLPEPLQYLIEPVLRYACRTEWDAFAHLDKASPLIEGGGDFDTPV